MDIARFGQMVLDGGDLDAARILGEKTVELMRRDHLPATDPSIADRGDNGIGYGLGVAVTLDPAREGNLDSPGRFGWQGYATTKPWIDPAEALVIVAMTRACPTIPTSWPGGPNVGLPGDRRLGASGFQSRVPHDEIPQLIRALEDHAGIVGHLVEWQIRTRHNADPRPSFSRDEEEPVPEPPRVQQVGLLGPLHGEGAEVGQWLCTPTGAIFDH